MNEPTRRVFLAIPASQQIQTKLIQFRKQHSNLPLNWHEPKNLHITLLPPVEIADEDLSVLIDTLKNYEGSNPFEIAFQSASSGPTPEKPRLLWATGEVSPEILLLKQSLEQLVHYKPDRNFQMHITLGRFSDNEINNTALHNFQETIHWHMLVDSFAIMESHFSDTKSDYRILQEFPFYVQV